MRIAPLFVLILLCSVLGSPGASAADVDVSVSQEETYVDMPVDVVVRITDALSHQEPTIKEVDGLKIVPAGRSVSSKMTIVNGRRIGSESVEYRFSVTPTRPGDFTIPPIEVKADKASTITPAVRFKAIKSDTGDRLFVEFTSNKEEVFVGEPIELTLKMFVRPFENPSTGQRFDISSHWGLFAFSQSDWGVFEDAMQETLGVMESTGRWPGSTTAMHENENATLQPYYLFQLTTTIYPDRSGPIDPGDIRVVYKYPEQFARRRSTFDLLMGSGFGSRLTISKYRPISAALKTNTITVKPVPTEGRPDTYRGAVGRYDMVAEAAPLNVTAGDPITLRLQILGDGPMDLVQPPALTQIADLTERFKIADEAMGGVVDGQHKTFVTTIRPLESSTEQIPAIPFTFFDPATEQYQTVYSDPISIEVKPAEVFSLDNDTVAATPPAADENNTATAETSRMIILDYPTGNSPNRLVRSSPTTPFLPSWLLGWLIAPPICSFAYWAFRFVQDCLHNRQTAAMVRRKLQQAQTPEDVFLILARFLSKRFQLPSTITKTAHGTESLERVIGHLRRKGHRTEANDCERLLNQHTQAELSVGDNNRQLIESAARWVDQIASESESSSTHRATSPAGSAAIGLLAFCLLGGLGKSTPAQLTIQLPEEFPTQTHENQLNTAATLSDDQLEQLAKRGWAAYQSALASDSRSGAASPNADTSVAWNAAAADLGRLADQGVVNDQLFFYLGNAASRQGDHARAIANYLRAIRLRPDEPIYRNNLALAREKFDQQQTGVSPNYGTRTINVASQFAAHVSRRGCAFVGIACWVLFWLAIVATRRLPALHLGRVATLGLIGFFAAAGTYGLQSLPLLYHQHAVVIVDTIELRSGDGKLFDVQASRSGVAGDTVRWTQQRTGWVHIELADGTSGWAETSGLELL